MAETPEPLTDEMLDGSERIRVGRKMRDSEGNRTGPVKVWTTAVLDIIKFARRISPTVKSLALSATKTLTFTTTDGAVTDLGSVAGPKGDRGDVGAQGPAGAPKRVERYTAVTNSSGVATFTFPTAFDAIPDVDVIQGWAGDQEVGGATTAVSKTGCTVLVKVSRATLLLSAGPFQTAPAGVNVTIRAIGN